MADVYVTKTYKAAPTTDSAMESEIPSDAHMNGDV